MCSQPRWWHLPQVGSPKSALKQCLEANTKRWGNSSETYFLVQIFLHGLSERSRHQY